MSFINAIYEEAFKDLAQGSFPFSLGVEVTNLCNLKCPMCPREIADRGYGNMDWDLFTRLVDEACDHDHGLFLPQGFGESFIHPRFAEMLDYIHQKKMARPTMVITNGTLLTEKNCNALIDAAVDLVSISLDGTDKEIFEGLRVNAKFERVVEGTKRLLRMRDERGLEQPRVLLRMIRMDRTEHLVDAFREAWEPYLKPGDEVNFSEYQTWNGTVEDHRVAPADELDPQTLPPCRMIYKTLQVYFDGRATPCCYDYDCTMEIGNANEQSIEEIWNGERARHFRGLHEAGRMREIPICRNCKEYVP